MATPSSQIVAAWVKKEITAPAWIALETICFSAVRKNWPTPSDDEILDFVEANIYYVSEYLRDDIAECVVDGRTSYFEIDNEPRPYIRACSFVASDIAEKLHRVDPFVFEHICAAILDKLGAQAQTTQRTNDGGVDFWATNFSMLPTEFGMPTACKAAIIGQAKRYRDPITEVRLREFVGAATLYRHVLRQGKVGPLTPVLWAFWTTADFDANAKKYARSAGLWYMDGMTLASYLDSLGLRDFTLKLPDSK